MTEFRDRLAEAVNQWWQTGPPSDRFNGWTWHDLADRLVESGVVADPTEWPGPDHPIRRELEARIKQVAELQVVVAAAQALADEWGDERLTTKWGTLAGLELQQRCVALRAALAADTDPPKPTVNIVEGDTLLIPGSNIGSYVAGEPCTCTWTPTPGGSRITEADPACPVHRADPRADEGREWNIGRWADGAPWRRADDDSIPGPGYPPEEL